ncbi:MAG: Asp23/Gls24 family envelope stress response protein [Ruminococcus sp.]|nr:Asp23/Gls24 family envelope stress response protein [Ruminococcus sp.]
MADVKKGAQSRLSISEDVIITVARLAALEVKGVAGLDGEISKMSKLRKNGPITVGVIGDVAALEIKIKVKNGCKAVAVAEEVQKAVKEDVQNMTGVAVARVNVIVNGVVFE